MAARHEERRGECGQRSRPRGRRRTAMRRKTTIGMSARIRTLTGDEETRRETAPFEDAHSIHLDETQCIEKLTAAAISSAESVGDEPLSEVVAESPLSS